MGFFDKSSNERDDSDKDKWRDKYLRLLDEQSVLERTHQQDQELLSRAIIRLSIIASRFDPQLDPYLQRIREHLKNGVENHKFRAELEHFTDALTRLTDTHVADRRSHPLQAQQDWTLLFDFLLQRYTSEQQQRQLHQLKENLKPQENVPRLFIEIARIIDNERGPDALLAQGSSAIALIEPRFVNNQLLSFLERIVIPEEFSQKAHELKQELAVSDAEPHFSATLDVALTFLSDLLECGQPKKQEIDKFLVYITDQLTELGLAVSGSSQAVIDASLVRSQLDQSVSEQMDDLHHRSMHATQLGPLKEIIASRIAKITQEIQEHKQQEAVRRETTQRQLDELGQKIKAMESETCELKSKLIAAKTNAMRDALTNLPNRIAYDEHVQFEMARWQRYQAPLCLAIWDIDCFKGVNDSYGHQFGDKVLVHIATQFAQNIRETDFIARFGGEEFVMLLPHTNKQSAYKLADKLRQLIEQRKLVDANGSYIAVTISCGITQFVKGDSYESAFARADQLLYRAKEQGRNQCCLG